MCCEIAIQESVHLFTDSHVFEEFEWLKFAIIRATHSKTGITKNASQLPKDSKETSEFSLYL